MNWKKFLSGAGMLAVLGVVGKVIGVFYRLPLTNILGAEGMGLYQMIFPLYSLILALSCGGLPAAISKYVSELNASGNRDGAKQALRCSALLLTIFGIMFAALVFIFREGIASLQGNARAGLSYAAIAPAIIFSGLIACFRGYFQGLQNLLPSGVSQIIEQGVKVGVGLLLAAIFVDMGVEYGVFGALMGVSVSEAAALVYLVIRYNIKGRVKRTQSLAIEAAADVIKPANKIKFSHVLREIYSVALPVTLGSLVIPISQVVDSFLVINLLVKNGTEVEMATSLFGLFNGPVGSLLNMPTVVTIALATSLLPRIAFCNSKGVSHAEATDKSFSLFTAFMLPCVAIFLITPRPVLQVLYSRGLNDAELSIAAVILRIESIDLLFLGLIQLTSAMMQGVGKARVPVLNLLIGALMKVAATLVLLRVIGIYGAAIGNVICYGVTCALDALFAKKYLGSYLNHKQQAKIFLCAAVFAAALSSYNLLTLFMNDIIAFMCALTIAGGIYLALLTKTKCILLREMLS
ncbi:MAG: polysaccharide biosynthesis protein [Clostridiales bacterium]|nr:polysaccharide biosynthesis protein [Clostridiales bacterium]